MPYIHTGKGQLYLVKGIDKVPECICYYTAVCHSHPTHTLLVHGAVPFRRQDPLVIKYFTLAF
jgi:hypothetical protein